MDAQTVWQLIFTASQVAAFFWIFAIGAGFTLVFFVFGELFDGLEDILHNIFELVHLDAIFDVDVEGGGGPSVFSPRVISVFITVFGGSGFLASVNRIGATGSSLIGLACGFTIASLFYLFFRWIYRQQSSSVMSNSQLVGMRGIVRTEIPNNGVGEVIVDYVGSRITRPAKSTGGEVISSNTNIIVKEVRGHTLIVECQN